MLAFAAVAACSQTPSVATSEPVDINIVAINDLHGYLQADPWRYKDATGAEHTLAVGGIATLGGMLDQLRAKDPQLLFVGNGDLIGGSPPLSAMWADEPTLEALRDMGLLFSTVGNHELDNGKAELLRQINGGCQSNRPQKACRFRPDFAGGGFPYIAANLVDTDTGKPLFAAYRIEQRHGVKIAFVGAVLRDVAQVVSAKGMQGLQASDEAQAINRVIPELKAQGVNAIVAMVHQGGSTPEAFDQADCSQLSGDIVEVAQRLDPAVDALLTAHTHQGYLCKVGKLSVSQGGSYGHLLTQLTLRVTPGRHEVTEVTARNLLADPKAYPQNARLAALQQQVQTRSDAVLQQPAGRIAVPRVSGHQEPSGESPLGDLIADSQLAMTRQWGAQIAFMNVGGIRANLEQPAGKDLTYAQVASVQPFGNTLVLMDLTGEQLLALLNQQFGPDDSNVLQVSQGLSYAWDSQRPVDSRVVPGSVRLNGKALDRRKRYRIVANSFLAAGAERFSMFKQGTQVVDSRLVDVDAMLAYLRRAEQTGTPVGTTRSAGRIVRND
ncbi:bifunctional metallophosphatase/5'-nucleotidase [Pseudomonas sp. S75]|uniref:bifunctional metallophosphatase/5'-nucleotidase n=1 Tax=unclassified Pseudomonas TaxID=196821 RepID=UPI001903C06D|nr:bifunctional metallophosphatase/5'-nucleotidase [Pseudomonas sp. S30]MBK0153065.1 bifunctional metallophosphatase/5'-nucleotidase [Pseudomonas sp. S75]